MRNFGRFVNEGTISNWHAEKESCSFSVSMLGTVSVRLIEKEMSSKVVYQGDALSKNDFTINVDISGEPEKPAKVNLSLIAGLNPVMKMMADKPIRQFMEMLIQEIENFRNWHEITE
jgi:carbon monoxide dehydrogenase subunit G